MVPVTMTTTLLEGTSGVYTFEIVDEVGQGINSVLIDTLTLTYYDLTTLTILNGRQDQDVRNAHDVILTTLPGPPLVTTITWVLQPEDTMLITPGLQHEYHVAQFRWTWAGGTRHGAHVMQFAVDNLAFVP